MERFEATIDAARGGGALVAVPAGVVEALGGGGRIPVRATFDGVPYRGSIVSMGGQQCLGLLTSIRDQLGKAPGDRVVVTLERDDVERTVTVPEDLAAALTEAGAADVFGRLSYSHQREYVTWISEAKRHETRQRRIAQTVERIAAT